MAKTNVWMSVSDLMTGLMVIFLFVSIAYMHRANKLIEQRKQVLTEYVDTKNKLYEELNGKFDQEIGNDVLAINNDLSMRFSKAETLFDNGDHHLTTDFQQTLKEIIPSYMNILLHDSLRAHIKEVRIEGHTDNLPYRNIGSDPYLSNLELSQRRATEVVKHIKKICARNFEEAEQKQIERWITAVGYSYTHALDANGNYAAESGCPIDTCKSRRVEIRIITDDYRVLEEIVKR